VSKTKDNINEGLACRIYVASARRKERERERKEEERTRVTMVAREWISVALP
jgi:hypothetical protein